MNRAYVNGQWSMMPQGTTRRGSQNIETTVIPIVGKGVPVIIDNTVENNPIIDTKVDQPVFKKKQLKNIKFILK